MLPLFDERPRLAERLAPKLRALAAEGIHIGTSSWKYEGWLGQIYSHERYLARGKFSRKRFESECITEYAEVFPTVCGDFLFYQFPAPEFWEKLFARVPRNLTFALKVPEEITVRQFPSHARFGARAGLVNPSFLNVEQLDALLLTFLRPYRAQIPVLILEFGRFGRRSYRSTLEFLADLDPFLEALPKDFRYGVEIRNSEFLDLDYLTCLRAHKVAHVFNAWTRMPELGDQIKIEEAMTTDFTVARALLTRGRTYEEAVEKFQPYENVQEVNIPTRDALRELIKQSRQQKRGGFIYVNNRLEGNAPLTIEAILED